jgi:hypothetical protein
VYSLVSSAVLAQDVLRHPYAARLAEAVDRVLALTPDEVVALGAPAPEQVRRRVLDTCSARPRPSSAAVEPSDGTERERTVDVLHGALLGSLEDLQDVLLREQPLLSAPAGARQVAVDQVAVAWAGPAATLPDAAALLAPWEAVLPPVGPPLGEVAGPALRDLLDETVSRSPAQWARTVAAHAAHRGDRRWSLAMHEACRVAWVHERLPGVARAQLAAVRALALSRTDASLSAVGMAVTAAVQGLCTADVLDEVTLATLMNDWEAGQ